MNEQRILYIHTGAWPSPSPSIVFVTGTVFGLAHHNPEELIIRNNSSAPTKEIFHEITGEDMPERCEIIRIGEGDSPQGHSRFYRKAARHVGRCAKRGEVRAVITRSIGFLPYLAYIRKRYKIPCFFETHDFYSDLSLRTDLKKNARIRKNNWYEKLFLPRLDGIICLTDTQAELFRRFYSSTPVTVAKTGLMKVERNDKPREKRICYIGSLDAHKGLGTILTALRQTVDKDVRLHVIGGKHEHEMREFKDLAQLVGVGNRVNISGWVHHSDIWHMMDRCIAGIVPLSDTPFNRYITSPLKILDCLSRSLPVIASDLPPVREYIEDGIHGVLFSPDNPENLAETIDRYVAVNMFDCMSKAIEPYAQRFLWTQRAGKIVEFINGLS